MREKEKIIDIGSRRYRLTKLNAGDGSYVAFKLTGVIIPALGVLSDKGDNGKKDDDGSDMKLLGAALNSMSRADFTEIQNLLLGTVLKLDSDGVPMPILKSDGTFVDEDLAMDAATVINLTVQAALFNLSGFFGGEGLNLTKV